MRHRIAVPAFREHPNAYDTADITPRRMQRFAQLSCEFLKSFRKNWPPNPIRRPPGFAHRTKRKSHPSGLISLRVPRVSLMDHFRMNDDRVGRPVIVEAIDLHWWYSRRRFIIREPFVNHIRKLSVLAHEDKNRRTR